MKRVAPPTGVWQCVRLILRYPTSSVVLGITADELEDMGEKLWIVYIITAWALLEAVVFSGR